MSADLLSLAVVFIAAVGLFFMSAVYSYRLQDLNSEVKTLKRRIDALEVGK